MNKYEQIKADMTTALKAGHKLRRMTLADMVASIDKASVAGKTRVEITDALVDEVMTKYVKTVQEMIDTCPDGEKYADRKSEYIIKLEIAKEYAPTIIDDIDEIRKMIYMWGVTNAVSITSGNKGIIMKAIMPWLKQNHCDMKAAQEALKLAMYEGDACIAAQMGERG